MENILITGGCGFIGSEIVKQLSERQDCVVTVLDAMTKQIHGEDWQKSYLYNSIKDKCKFIKADVRDFDAVQKAVAEADYVIHLAAETGTGQSMYQINQYNEVNIMGTSNVIQAISSAGKANRVKKIILSSSRSVYGEGKYICPKCGVVYPKGRKKKALQQGDYYLYCDNCGSRLKLTATTEDSLIQPNSLYAFTKFSQEKMLQTMCPALGVNYTIFRFQNVYGVGQSLKNPYTGILSIFSTLLLGNKPINIFEDGLESRDFINVKDIACGVIKALDMPASNGEIINLGSGIGTCVIDIAKFLKKIYKSDSQLNVTGDFRLGDIAHNVADISKSKRLLDFEPQVSLEDGLSAFCKWVLGEDKDNNGYEASLKEMELKGMLFRKGK